MGHKKIDVDGRSLHAAARGSSLIRVQDELEPPGALNGPNLLDIRKRPRIAPADLDIMSPEPGHKRASMLRAHDEL